MLLTPHTFVGVAVASVIGNPLISVPLSFILHFVGDKVPHWDFYSDTPREERIKGWRPMAVMADLAIGVAVGMFFTLYGFWVKDNWFLGVNIFLCGFASCLPDALTGPVMYFSNPPKPFKLIHKVQSKMQFQAPLPWGILSQFVVVGGCLLIIFKFLL